MTDETVTEDAVPDPPGPSLRDPSYRDLCGFFATFPEGREWQPRFGDWVARADIVDPLLVLDYAMDTEYLLLAGAGMHSARYPRAECIWLPTFDQLRALLRAHFGTVGVFSSTFKDVSWWYTGQMLGMTVTNLQPLAEGKSPEEAALKALLMRHQW